MARNYGAYTNKNMSQRSVAMVLSVASAVILSPLYVGRRDEGRFWSSGFAVPMVLLGLIMAIRASSSSGNRASSVILSSDSSWILRIGSSSCGLAGILVMLILVLSWQNSVQDFLWR